MEIAFACAQWTPSASFKAGTASESGRCFTVTISAEQSAPLDRTTPRPCCFDDHWYPVGSESSRRSPTRTSVTGALLVIWLVNASFSRRRLIAVGVTGNAVTAETVPRRYPFSVRRVLLGDNCTSIPGVMYFASLEETYINASNK